MELTHLPTHVILCTTFLIFFIYSTSALKKGYMESCQIDADCESGTCNVDQGTCDCLSFGKSKQFYDHELKMCFSKVGQLCTLSPTSSSNPASSKDSKLPEYNCAPGSECIVLQNQSWSKRLFGTCICKFATQAREGGRRCISNVELRTSSNEKPPAMDQVVPEGWNRSSGSSEANSSLSLVLSVCIATMLGSSAIR